MAFLTSSPIPKLRHVHFPSRRPRARSSPFSCAASPARAIPTSLSETLALTSASITSALGNSHTHLRVTALIPGLNPAIEDTVPYSSETLFRLAHGVVAETPALASLSDVSLLFPSAGTAASAAKLFTSECPTENIRAASFYLRDAVEDRVSQSANVIVSPISSRGDRVMDDLEKVLSEAPGAIWILLNAQLDVDRAAVGMKESTRRSAFMKRFVPVFYFRNLFEIKRPKLIAVERGALMQTYERPWQLFVLNDSYELIKELPEMPSVDVITAEIRRARGRKPVKTDPKVDREFLVVLLLCAGFFLAVLLSFKFGGNAGI